VRILHITTHLNKGGITSYISSLAIGLKDKGHDVVIASSGGSTQDILVNKGIEHINIPIRTKKELSFYVLRSCFYLKKYLSKNKVDLIHAHTRVAQVLASFLSKKFKIPLVTTCHGFFKPRWHRRKFPCWGDKVIAISNQVQNHLMKDFSVKEENVLLIHNGVDVDRSNNSSKVALKKEMKIPLDYFIVGSAARFSDVKGLEYLIKSIPFILRDYQNVTLVLIGYGKEELRLRQVVSELDLKKYVIFYKPAKDIFHYLKVLDIFVMPSLQEGLGLSILEAQAQNIPVIASNVGGIPDVIEHNVTGILVAPKDPSAIGKAVTELIKNQSLCQQLKSNAYSRLKEKFSLSKMVNDTEKAYKELTHVI